MINIYSDGQQITYTAGDTFFIDVTSVEGFEEGTKLNFQIAENEQSESVVDSVYELSDGAFEIVLSDAEKERLSIGNYIYKIAVVDAGGDIITRKSGELIVKWGA